MSTRILIKNGRLFTGDPNEQAVIRHLLIEDGIITKISAEEIFSESDTEIYDASGKWITPVFLTRTRIMTQK